MVRGEVFRLTSRRGTRGHEQRGARFAVIVQADEFLDLSTTLVAPTSTSARAASFRPAITLERRETRVLLEQTTVVDPQRLGRSAGRLGPGELRAMDEAICLILGLCVGARSRPLEYDRVLMRDGPIALERATSSNSHAEGRVDCYS